MAYKFPWTNYHELNLDWILEQVKKLFAQTERNNEIVTQYDDRLTEVELIADNAAEMATQAQSDSTAALSIAATAQQTAATAQQTATAAQTEAVRAQQTGAAAQQTAEQAQQTAEQAQQVTQNFNGRLTQAETNIAAALRISEATAEELEDVVENVSALSEAVDKKADVIYNTVSGEVASFNDGADNMPIKSLIANIEPIQSGSGDPSPSNVRPISGRTGLNESRLGTNLYNGTAGVVRDAQLTSATIADTTINGWSAHKVTVVGSTTSWGWRILYRNIMNYIRPATTYTITFLSSVNANISMTFGNSGGAHPVAPQKGCTKTDLGGGVYKYNVTFTTYDETNDAWNYSDQTFNPFSTYINSQAGEFIYSDLVVANGNYIADSYEAYAPLSITVSWQSEAGIVYGGTLDVITGVLSVDWKTVTIDGTGGNGASINNNIRVRYPIPNDSVVWSDASTKSGYVICNMFPEGTNAESATGTVCFHLRANGSHEVMFGFGSSFPGASTLSEAMEWITAHKPVVCYKLAESIVYQLTPQQINTLLGNNTIFTDCGSVSVTYPADTKLYIDNKFAELQALILEH